MDEGNNNLEEIMKMTKQALVEALDQWQDTDEVVISITTYTGENIIEIAGVIPPHKQGIKYCRIVGIDR